MEYITVIEAAEKWGVSRRSLSHHLIAGRILGAVKKGSFWLIPENAAKPEDKRFKKVSAQSENEAPFQPLTENKDLLAQIIRHFPDPIFICAQDGTLLFANDIFWKRLKVSNPPEDLRKYNMLNDPELERMGIKDFVLRTYRGEALTFHDVKFPFLYYINRFGGNAEMLLESGSVNVTSFPAYDENHQITYIVTVLTTSRYYQGREEVRKGKEYIDEHWKEEFNADRLLDIVHMSKQHYTRLFKQHTGTTPHLYHQSVKLKKLVEMLCDNNLSIAQVFNECGVDYNGTLAKKLKQELGMTPSEYREKVTKK